MRLSLLQPFQPSIESMRQGRMCGDFKQLHICVSQ